MAPVSKMPRSLSGSSANAGNSWIVCSRSVEVKFGQTLICSNQYRPFGGKGKDRDVFRSVDGVDLLPLVVHAFRHVQEFLMFCLPSGLFPWANNKGVLIFRGCVSGERCKSMSCPDSVRATAVSSLD